MISVYIILGLQTLLLLGILSLCFNHFVRFLLFMKALEEFLKDFKETLK